MMSGPRSSPKGNRAARGVLRTGARPHQFEESTAAENLVWRKRTAPADGLYPPEKDGPLGRELAWRDAHGVGGKPLPSRPPRSDAEMGGGRFTPANSPGGVEFSSEMAATRQSMTATVSPPVAIRNAGFRRTKARLLPKHTGPSAESPRGTVSGVSARIRSVLPSNSM